MGNEADKKFTWVIKNFSSLQSNEIYSNQFVISGCKWRLLAYPKGKNYGNNLSMYLEVTECESLPCGWRRHVIFSFTIVNPISEKLSQLGETKHWFNEKERDWGFTSMLSLTEINAKDSGFLVNDELKVVAELDVLQVIGQLDVNGFLVLHSQVESVKSLFEKHPDIASKFRIKNPLLKTAYMNVLLSLIEVVRHSLKEVSKDDLVDAYAVVESMTDAGFSLEWLKKKLDEMSEKKEKEEACENRMQELEEELKELKEKCSNVEALLEKENFDLLAAKAPLPNDDVF